MITKYQPAKWPGRYRAGGIYVTSSGPLEPSYTGPDADVVPGLMGELVDWLHGGDIDAPEADFAGGVSVMLDFVNPRRSGAAPYRTREYFTVRGAAAFALGTGSADWAEYHRWSKSWPDASGS